MYGCSNVVEGGVCVHGERWRHVLVFLKWVEVLERGRELGGPNGVFFELSVDKLCLNLS